MMKIGQWLVLAAMSASLGLGVDGGSRARAQTQKVALTAPERQARALGYGGIDRFFQQHGKELNQLEQKPNSPRWQSLNAKLDRLCQQRDCYASKLYWHRDFDRAKAEAKQTNKPMLSLRLLGDLDEELSCANSRFFRIALYSNPEIAKLLRDKYVLHWQSVRPVPKITIDFGDGRKVQQTITGNSIHYILDRDGKPIDALPGLYSPQAFQTQLTTIADFTARYHQTAATARTDLLAGYHRDRLSEIQTNWQQDLTKLGIKLDLPKLNRRADNSVAPTALEAAPIAISKMAVELPIVSQMRTFRRVNTTLVQATNEAVWTNLGKLHRQDATLAANSLALMRRKQPQYINSNPKNSDAFSNLVDKFEGLIAIDSVRNEYQLHSQIYQWLMSDASFTVEALNELVYDRLFLTPKGDRWLGLMTGDGYTGIEKDGIN
jgi:hypothetical protein